MNSVKRQVLRESKFDSDFFIDSAFTTFISKTESNRWLPHKIGFVKFDGKSN